MSESFRVVASVGTMHYPFDRFVQWLEPWTTKNQATVVFQHGSTRPMRDSENHEMLSPKELLEQYKVADAIVLQGGAGGLMDARKAGRIPIVVPRVPAGREHIDDHQVIMCRKLAEQGIVHVAESAEELEQLLDGVRAGTVSSRLDHHETAPGVRAALKTLPDGRPARTSRLERGSLQFTQPRRHRHRRTLRGAVSRFVHQGVLGYVLALAVAVALLDRFEVSTDFRRAAIGVIGAWLIGSFALLPAYARGRSLHPLVWSLVVLGVATLVALAAGATGSADLRVSLIAGLAAAGTLAAAAIANRMIFRRIPTVVVGDEPSVRRLAVRWNRRSDVRIVASCAWRGKTPGIPDASLSELVPQVLGAVDRNRARSVVVASQESLTTATLRDLSWALQRAGAECLVLANGDATAERVRSRQVGDEVALMTRPPAGHMAAMAFKSVADRVGAGLGLLVFSPLLVAVAIAVRLTSRQPAILRHARTGRDGVTFVMYTFRTMVATPAGDQHVGRLGRFLRRTSIDELPRLFNVLKGDMSLVGPRPSPPDQTLRYDDRVWRRLSVRPGVTGLSQVSGRSRLSAEETVRIDLQYVDHWNLRLDARILLRTMRVALTRDLTR